MTHEEYCAAVAADLQGRSDVAAQAAWNARMEELARKPRNRVGTGRTGRICGPSGLFFSLAE